jgi:hypothetical protein
MPDQSTTELCHFKVPDSAEWQEPGGKPFVPSYFVEVPDTLGQKLEAIGVYHSEMPPIPPQ